MKGKSFHHRGLSRRSRRSLLKAMVGVGASAALPGHLRWLARAEAAEITSELPNLTTRPSVGPVDPDLKSTVAHIQAAEVVAGIKIHENLLLEMLEEGVALATDTPRGKDAWQKLLKPDDVIGIKFNRVGADELGTSASMARQLVRSLKRAGFDPAQIMLIEAPDKMTAELGTKPRIFGWSGDKVSFDSGSDQLAALLQEVTAIINVPFLKTHNIAMVSGCLKNLSHALVRRPALYHKNHCTPYVGDIVALPAIRSKLRIHVVNALQAVYKGGPEPTSDGIWTHAGLLIGTDPVAVDQIGLDLINRQRARAELPAIGGLAARIPHIHAAAEKGLGTDDQDYINFLSPKLF